MHIADVQADPEYKYVLRDVEPIRTTLSVPILKGNDLVGTITIYKLEVKPFTEKQIALVETFANQAVIAIENTRLLNELRQRTDDLRVAGAADRYVGCVEVISSSPGELQPVFDTMLAKAVELCEASFGAMWLVDGEGYRTAALHGDLPKAYVEQWRSGTLHRPKAVIPMMRAIRSRKPVHVTDMLKDKAYLEGDPLAVSVVKIAGIRRSLTSRCSRGAKQSALYDLSQGSPRFLRQADRPGENFAAQAVIAIENTRLLSELRARSACSSRPLPPTCSRSSAGRHSICRQCSTR